MMTRRALRVWLAVVLTSALAACGTGVGSGEPSGSSPKQVEAKLRRIAAEADRPVYYLGQRFRDWPLTEALADDTGRVDALYGGCVGDGDTCGAPVNVINEPLDPAKWSMAVGCSRLPPVRGVPAVHFGDALVLLTADSLVTIGVMADDTATAIAAAQQLRQVGADTAGDALPAPDSAAVSIIDAACGRNPGDAGRTERDLDSYAVSDKRVPDFTVRRLGGGDLRWADYVGRPVVVVVGDVPDVVGGIRRVVTVASGRTPAVMGLVWKPFGLKDAPAPIEQIEKEAGNVRVPVGYAAIPQPAVWFSDLAEVDPAQSGVIAFVDAQGVVIRHLRANASDDAIAAALDALER